VLLFFSPGTKERVRGKNITFSFIVFRVFLSPLVIGGSSFLPIFRIIDRIKHQKTRKKYFEIDDTPQNMPTKFKIKEEVWKEFLKDVVKFEPDIDSREDTDFVRARNLLGRDHLPNWWYEWFTEEQLKELKTEIERNIIDEIVQQIRNLFPNATILLKKDEDEEERKVVDLWPVWKDKLGNKLEEKFKFIRKIGKKLDPPITRGDRDAGINNILNAFIDKRSILIDGQNKIPTAGDVEHTLLRHSYFKNNPTKIYLTSLNWQKTWKAIQMRNLLEDMPWGGLMECYDNKLRKGKYVDAIWENPPRYCKHTTKPPITISERNTLNTMNEKVIFFPRTRSFVPGEKKVTHNEKNSWNRVTRKL